LDLSKKHITSTYLKKIILPGPINK